MSDERTAPAPPPCLQRRGLLIGATGLVGLLAACSHDDNRAGATSAAPSTPADTAAPAASAPAASPSAVPADGTGTTLAKLDDVPAGGGTVVMSVRGPVLLLRGSTNRVTAYLAVCPHNGVTVNAPTADGTIVCPAHHSRFRATDGSRISGPAPTGLTKLTVTVNAGQVRLA